MFKSLTVLIFVFMAYTAHADSTCEDVLEMMQTWLAADSGLGVPKHHQRRIVWAGEFGVQSKNAALFIHGLYNSPNALVALEDVFTSRSANLMTTRLSGHHEANRNLLASEIKWQTWWRQSETDFLLAMDLLEPGQKLDLVGHSTGATIAVGLALKYPEKVRSLTLFSPVFGVHPLARLGARFLNFTGLNLTLKDGKIVTGHAGLEIEKAVVALQHWIIREERSDAWFLARRLQTIPVFMINTRADLVVQRSKAKIFFDSIAESNPLKVARSEFLVPLKQKVTHDAITTEANPSLPEIKTALTKFLSDPQ